MVPDQTPPWLWRTPGAPKLPSLEGGGVSPNLEFRAGTQASRLGGRDFGDWSRSARLLFLPAARLFVFKSPNEMTGSVRSPTSDTVAYRVDASLLRVE